MSVKGRSIGRIVALCGVGIALIAIGGLTGCVSPGEPSPVRGPAIIASPQPDPDFPIVSPASAVETWIVHTRGCEQEMGSNPWPSLTVARLDQKGGPLHGSEPEALLSQMASRPSVILIHGNGYTYKESTNEGVEIRAQLEALGGLPPETLFIIFDWPSEQLRRSIEVDLNEKAKRSRIGGYHLARFLQAAPANATVCLMGQSDGGRVALTTLHLLSGAGLRPFLNEPGAQLTSARTDLRLRGVVLEAAVGHTWLDPGDRLGSALPNTEALLNLWNSGDYALAVYIFGSYTGLKPALGRVGLSPHDLKKLGPLKDRVEEINHHSLSRWDHTLFTQVLTYPGVAERIAAYTAWRDVSDGLGKRYSTRDLH
jgi:Alpha/beta hydrolase of unknown function (DUF900)